MFEAWGRAIYRHRRLVLILSVAVVAFDPNGNRSPRSNPLTFTTRQTQPVPTW